MKNTNENTLVIFGAPDHEKQLARITAEKAGCQIATATYQGNPVHAGNAYKADGYRWENGTSGNIHKVILFECGGPIEADFEHNGLKIIRCDHHNPGDPGYGMPPEEYWRGSSLGQLCIALGLSLAEKAKQIEYAAAADHCPADAYAGRCQGIDPKEFFEYRLARKAIFNLGEGAEWEELDEEIFRIRNSIENAICFELEEAKSYPQDIPGVLDLRSFGHIAELPEAALMTGLAYMAKIDETDRDRKPTGNFKIVLGGHTTPEQVKSFMAWADTLLNKVGKPYGNPTRGYAGVVVRDERAWCPTCQAEMPDNVDICPECGLPCPRELFG